MSEPDYNSLRKTHPELFDLTGTFDDGDEKAKLSRLKKVFAILKKEIKKLERKKQKEIKQEEIKQEEIKQEEELEKKK